jgi:hypothetical protein
MNHLGSGHVLMDNRQASRGGHFGQKTQSTSKHYGSIAATSIIKPVT